MVCGTQMGGLEFVKFEDAGGMESFVNPERVVWVREYTTEPQSSDAVLTISSGGVACAPVRSKGAGQGLEAWRLSLHRK